MLCKPEKAEARDWIAELNQTAATEVDRAVIERQRRQWPLNVMGANNRQAPRIKGTPRPSWILRESSSMMSRSHRERFKATTTHSNTTRMAIRSCQRALIADLSQPWRRRDFRVQIFLGNGAARSRGDNCGERQTGSAGHQHHGRAQGEHGEARAS
jgi:hypothetical protein